MQPFWQTLAQFGNRTAIIDGFSGRKFSYTDLEISSGRFAQNLSRRRGLVIVLARNSISSLVALIGALRAGHAAWLIRDDTDEDWFSRLITEYRPVCILGPENRPISSQQVVARAWPDWNYVRYDFIGSPAPIHDDLSLILSTSGSLGDPKGVRLSGRNVSANANQITEALDIHESQRALVSLPLSYAYGLSVVNSHLSVGAAVILEQRTILDANFWRAAHDHNCTTLAGVGTTYDLIRQAMPNGIELPSLRTVTQAGSRLSTPTASWLRERLCSRGVRVFKMYGMTEATSRISVLPHDEFAENIDSVGRPVRGGAVTVGEDGELIYAGPNVMLGYAKDAEDLTRPGSTAGVLATGDIGRLDRNGLLYVDGRLDRVTKIFGYRINLDEVEAFFEDVAKVAASVDKDKIVIRYVNTDNKTIKAKSDSLAERLRLPTNFIRLIAVDRLDYSSSGKLIRGDMGALREGADHVFIADL